MKLWSEIILPNAPYINKADKSKKEPIVFLHGTGANARMWTHQVAFFKRLGHTCLTIDLRGHGFSHEPYETTDLKTHLVDVQQTLQINQINFPAYFVGHSLGAIISLFMANQQPQLIKGIFAACLPGKVIKPVAKSFKLFLNGPLQTLKESELKRYLGWRERTLVEMPPFTLNQIHTHFAGLDLMRSLPQVDCPVHLACGRFDPVALYWHAKELQQKIPGSTLKIFEWGGHNFMDAKPDEFNKWIAGYLP